MGPPFKNQKETLLISYFGGKWDPLENRERVSKKASVYIFYDPCPYWETQPLRLVGG